MKICSKCKRELEESSFVKSANYIGGLYPICKSCRKATRMAKLDADPMCSKCCIRPHYKSHPYCPTCMASFVKRSKVGDVRTPKPTKLCNRCKINKRVQNYKHLCPECAAICPKCGIRKRAASAVWCSECISERMKAFRARRRAGPPEKRWYAKLNPLQKQKKAARSAFQRQVSLGRIIPQPCGVCGRLETEGHHHNGYDKEHRFDVLWFCREHHLNYELWLKKKLTAHSTQIIG